MLEHLIEFMLPEVVSTLEIIGIAVITIGSLKAFYHHIKMPFIHKHYPIRIELANTLALGLEFRMGAEILKTVLVRSLSGVYILGVIILLRMLLSLMIYFGTKIEREHGSASEASLNSY